VEPDGRVVPETLDVLAHVRDHGMRPVLLTGRSRWSAEAVARALGIDDVICELGAVVRVGTQVELAAPEAVPFPREALLAALPGGGTQEHEPGTPRTSGLVLRSAIPAHELTDVLHAAGFGHWCAQDNGPSHRPLDDGRPARVVHVLPSGVDKARGVRLHLQLRDLLPEECVLVGDSPADLTCRSVVPRTVLVRSADATAMATAADHGVPITAHAGARGALEAVRRLIARPQPQA
jgi:hydroxymethylpyrimidine pyrophosphatase-like HAD family hydrolase